MTVKVEQVTDHIVKVTKPSLQYFLMSSGDGYSLKGFIKEIKALEKATGYTDFQIYCGGDYDEIPFDEIYSLWRDQFPERNKQLTKPTREQLNSYNHGFFLLLP
jgi:hypothetical protein